MLVLVSLLVALARGGGVSRGQGAQHLATVIRREGEESEADFHSALARNPRDALTRNAFARWLVQGNRPEEAEMEHRAAVETRPTCPRLRTEFAEFLAPKSTAQAEAQYLEGLRFAPKSALLRASYARFLVVHKQEEALALAQYEEASDLADPQDDPEAFAEMLAQYGTLITRSHGKGRSSIARAEQQFVRAAESGPSALSKHRYATFLRFDKKDYRAAEAVYAEALELDDAFPSALCGYATLLDVLRGNFDQAEPLYERAEAQGECLAAFATFLRRVRKDFVKMADVVASEQGQKDTKLQASEWDNARIWHRLNAEGGLGNGVVECVKVGADAVRVLACVLLYLAQYLTQYRFLYGAIFG